MKNMSFLTLFAKKMYPRESLFDKSYQNIQALSVNFDCIVLAIKDVQKVREKNKGEKEQFLCHFPNNFSISLIFP